MNRAEAIIDPGAIRDNIALLRARALGADFMAVVKANGYGHGIVPVAGIAVESGADCLGVAYPSEAMQLREAGVDAPILAWLYTPQEDLAPLVASDVQISVASVGMLEQVLAAAASAGARARIHMKLDTGLGRNGCPPSGWQRLLHRVRLAQDEGLVEVIGIWSHLVSGEEPGAAITAEQIEAFELGLHEAERNGIVPRYRHLANSGGVLNSPETHYDMVRCGIAMYGLSPGPATGTSAELGLRPAMTLRSRIALVKTVPAGQGVSYNHRYRTSRPTRLALVPVGYGDGVPRAGSGKLPVLVGDQQVSVAGTVAMDQVVLDVGDLRVRSGDEVTLFGGAPGQPSADDWARLCGTINYEIVTGISARVARMYP